MTNTNTTETFQVRAEYGLGSDAKRYVTMRAIVVDESELYQAASCTVDVYAYAERTRCESAGGAEESFQTVDFVEWFNRARVEVEVSADDGHEVNRIWNLLPDLSRDWIEDYLDVKRPIGATNTTYPFPFTAPIAKFLIDHGIAPVALGKDYKRADALTFEDYLLATDTIAIAKAAVFEGMDTTLDIDVLKAAAERWPLLQGAEEEGK